jgi:hypothetical protein
MLFVFSSQLDNLIWILIFNHFHFFNFHPQSKINNKYKSLICFSSSNSFFKNLKNLYFQCSGYHGLLLYSSLISNFNNLNKISNIVISQWTKSNTLGVYHCVEFCYIISYNHSLNHSSKQDVATILILFGFFTYLLIIQDDSF